MYNSTDLTKKDKHEGGLPVPDTSVAFLIIVVISSDNVFVVIIIIYFSDYFSSDRLKLHEHHLAFSKTLL